jgi:hypothetical protein
MSATEHREAEGHMKTLDDHALLRLVALQQWAWRPEAISIACAELRRRGLPVPTREDYWTRFPTERIGPDGFCAQCRAATTDDSPGNIFSLYLVGTRLIGFRDTCPACGSVLQRKWVCIGLPLIPLSKYRVIYTQDYGLFRRFVGRKAREEESRSNKLAAADRERELSEAIRRTDLHRDIQ